MRLAPTSLTTTTHSVISRGFVRLEQFVWRLNRDSLEFRDLNVKMLDFFRFLTFIEDPKQRQ